MNLTEFDIKAQKVIEGLLAVYPKFGTYLEVQKSNIDQRKYVSIKYPPDSENGKEPLFIKIKGDNLILSYDYYNAYYKTNDVLVDNIVNIIREIFEENLVAMSTRSDSGIVVTPLLKSPSKAKASEKSWNFRIRSWKGTYDSGE